jgi:hypothetical protein
MPWSRVETAAQRRGMARNIARNTARLTLLAGIALLSSVVVLVILSRSGEYNLFSGSWDRWLAHPRAATLDEQREFLRLSLGQIIEPTASARARTRPGVASGTEADEHAGAEKGGQKSVDRSSKARTGTKFDPHMPRLALSLMPRRLCSPMPQTRGCQPDANGRILIAKDPPPSAQQIQRVPIELRDALVRIKPAAGHLPDPGLFEVVSYAQDEALTPEKQRLISSLLDGRWPGGLGHASFSWAIVSADGKTALMDALLVSGRKGSFMAIEVFRHDGVAWRRAERLQY